MWLNQNKPKNKTKTASKRHEMAALDQDINEHHELGVDDITSNKDKRHLLLSVEQQNHMTVEQKRW